jgi:hypothetical protein
MPCVDAALLLLLLLLLQNDPKYRAGTMLRKPQARLRHFVGACASKRFDDAGGGGQRQKACSTCLRVVMGLPAAAAHVERKAEMGMQ